MTRTIGLIFSVVCMAASVVAAGAEDPLEMCYRDADPTSRVACYDHEMQRRHATASAMPKRTDDNVGLEGKELHRKLKEEGVAEVPLKAIVATITGLLPRANNEYAFELDNGQTWEQSEPKANLYINLHDAVTIKPGVLGAFYMTTASSQRFRVRRIR